MIRDMLYQKLMQGAGDFLRLFHPLQKRLGRIYLSFLIDTFIAALSLPLALFLRLGDGFFTYSSLDLFKQIFGFTCIAVGAFLWTQSYRGMWRYVSIQDLINILYAVVLSVLLFIPFLILTHGFDAFPRSAFLIQGILFAGLLGGIRVAYRAMMDQFSENGINLSLLEQALKVLLIGAGDSAEFFLREIKRQRSPQYEVVGLVGKSSTHVTRRIHGFEILGALNQLEMILSKLLKKEKTPDLVILADPELKGPALQHFLKRAEGLSLKLAQLPELTELTNPKEMTRLKPLLVEDLLGRPQAALDRQSMLDLIKGKRILITGVGGSIGGELARQIADFSPAHMALLDHSEYLLYQAQLDLLERAPYLSQSQWLVDIREKDRIFQVIATEKPDLVFHAAALKHVPLVEAHPLEGILTNVLGTRYLADACLAHHVAGMLLISTDKAINPTSILGSTKRLAESYCQALDVSAREEKSATRFMTVRFGNVLGSTGSVVPLFRRQIEKGGPITITHPEITRYFMTIHEAVELVLQATALGLKSEGQRGKIFVLDMGEPVSILDLAENMIRLSGLRPHTDIKITFTGLRPGEKLFEELFHKTEKLSQTASPAILIGAPRFVDHQTLGPTFKDLEHAVRLQKVDKCLEILKKLVPEYRPETHPSPSPYPPEPYGSS